MTKDEKNFYIIFFLSRNLPSGTLSSVLKIQFCVQILFCKRYFSTLNTFMRKRRIRSRIQIRTSVPFGIREEPINMWIQIRFRIPNNVYNITTDLGAPTASLRAGSGSTAWTAALWVSLRTCNTVHVKENTEFFL